MRHDWVYVADNGILGPPKRVCQNCRATQERITDHAWMRVTGYRWRPLVGRCAQPTVSPPEDNHEQ